MKHCGCSHLSWEMQSTPSLNNLPPVMASWGVQRELQERLAQRGLAKSGKKAELAQRLYAALAEEQEMVLQDQREAANELQRQFQKSTMSPPSRCALCEDDLAHHYAYLGSLLRRI